MPLSGYAPNIHICIQIKNKWVWSRPERFCFFPPYADVNECGLYLNFTSGILFVATLKQKPSSLNFFFFFFGNGAPASKHTSSLK